MWLNVIKMNNDKSLSVTISSTIHQYENNADTIIFLLPPTYEDNDLADNTIYLRYILPNEYGKSEVLERQTDMYMGYNQYRLKVGSRFTSVPGNIELWLSVINEHDDIIMKTGSATIRVMPSKDIVEYFDDTDINQLDQVTQKLTNLEISKADNLITTYDNGQYIQLLSGGLPIGDRVLLSSGNVSASDCFKWVIDEESLPAFSLASEGFIYYCKNSEIGYTINEARDNWIPVIHNNTATVNSKGLLSPVDKASLDQLLDSIEQYAKICETVNSITSNDGCITISGETTIPVIGVAVSLDPSNALQKKDDGLYVSNTGVSMGVDAGNGLQAVDGTISINIETSKSNGLSISENGLALDLATLTTSGAMSASDKMILDELEISYEEMRSVISEIYSRTKWSEM